MLAIPWLVGTHKLDCRFVIFSWVNLFICRSDWIYRGYYMAMRRYGFHLWVLIAIDSFKSVNLVSKTSLTRSLCSLVRDVINTRRYKIRISAQPCNILYLLNHNWQKCLPKVVQMHYIQQTYLNQNKTNCLHLQGIEKILTVTPGFHSYFQSLWDVSIFYFQMNSYVYQKIHSAANLDLLFEWSTWTARQHMPFSLRVKIFLLF